MLRIVPAVLLLVTAIAQADVYRWVDENGDVHYGDLPRQVDAERMNIRTGSPSGDDSPEETEESNNSEESAPSKPETPFSMGKEEATAEERCREFKARVKRYSDAGDMYIDQPDGSRHKLAPEERERLIQRTQAQADKACSEARGY